MSKSSAWVTKTKDLFRFNARETSAEAARSIEPNKLEGIVFEAIESFGPSGCISDDVRASAQCQNLAYSSVTARYKALFQKGMIVYSGDKRPGRSGRNQAVMVATDQQS